MTAQKLDQDDNIADWLERGNAQAPITRDTLKEILRRHEWQHAYISGKHDLIDAIVAAIPDPAQTQPNPNKSHAAWLADGLESKGWRDYIGMAAIELRRVANAQAAPRGTMKVTREMVDAVRDDKCFSCGVHSFEDCPRFGSSPCGREHMGGIRAATE